MGPCIKTVSPNKCCPPLKSCKSRELKGGILYTDCFCLRRNGLQYDCRRSGCQNSLLCERLPAPLCGPANVACIKHCANPHAEPLCNICKMRWFWNNLYFILHNEEIKPNTGMISKFQKWNNELNKRKKKENYCQKKNISCFGYMYF